MRMVVRHPSNASVVRWFSDGRKKQGPTLVERIKEQLQDGEKVRFYSIAAGVVVVVYGISRLLSDVFFGLINMKPLETWK